MEISIVQLVKLAIRFCYMEFGTILLIYHVEFGREAQLDHIDKPKIRPFRIWANFFFFEALVLDLTSIWILIFKFVEIDLGSS